MRSWILAIPKPFLYYYKSKLNKHLILDGHGAASSVGF